MIRSEHCRAARCWLDWSQADLAENASVGLSTVRDFEKGRRTPIRNNLEAIQRALEAAGIQFIMDTSGEIAGVTGPTKPPKAGS
ncbi:helix-turn-helix domain-containing protein [Marinicaulis aureus]|uniref:Helix-turn-helix domain-containing protein n=1 Tax=Hyphococcus aureus TaxID=2666033 RepID=A0ABW1KXR4_9PROT